MRAAQNPFRTDCVTNLSFQPQQSDWDTLWQKLAEQNGRGAIVGPCGSGKTTFLGEIEMKLRLEGFEVTRINFNEKNRTLGAFNSRQFGLGDVLLVDGVEQLSLFHRWRLSQAKPQFFIVTSHTPTFLPTWIRTTTSPQLLQSLCAHLGVEIGDFEAQKRWQTTRGDLREVFWQLYDENSQKKHLDL